MKIKFSLLAIILLASVLRLYKLDTYPAINADEAAIGYNAYSLIETGLDEHGNPWPVHFQSFNDWKPGLIFYLVIPTIKLLGLTALGIRLIPALLGIGTVFTLYFLVYELFRNKYQALAASFVLAISPWHIHFSRGAWETNVATFFIISGTLFFVKSSRKSIFFIPSAIFFALSLYTYHSARILTPLLGLFLVLIYNKHFRQKKRHIFLSGLLLLIIVLPLVLDFFGPAGLSRASGVGLFADSGPIHKINEQRRHHNTHLPSVSRVFHNKATTFAFAFMENWSRHFDGSFLFINGDEIERNKVPEMGQLHLFELITIGTALIAIAKAPNKSWALVFTWLLLSPIAASLTFQSPHALRAQAMSVPLAIVSGFGLYKILVAPRPAKLHGTLVKWGVVGSIAIIIIWSLAYYLQMYYVHMAKKYPFSSQYGVSELFNYINVYKNDYKKIIITDRYDQPYILALYYLNFPPEKFQNSHNLSSKDEFGFSTVRNFGQFSFRSIGFEEDLENHKDALIIGTDEEIPDEANVVKEIYGTNSYKYFQIVAN